MNVKIYIDMNIQKFLVNIIAAGLVISGAGSCSVMESISSKLPGNTSTENAEKPRNVKEKLQRKPPKRKRLPKKKLAMRRRNHPRAISR